MKPYYGIHSLRFKIILACAVIQAALLAASISNRVILMNDSLTEQTELRVAGLKLLLNAAVAPLVMQRDYAALQDILNEVVSIKELEYIEVIDRHSKRMAWAGTIPSSFSAERDLDEIPQDHVYDQEQLLQLAEQPMGHIRFGISTHMIEEANTETLQQGISLALLVIAATVVLLILVSGFLTRHLRALAEGAQKIAAGDLNVVIKAKTRDEVGNTARAFNAMVVSLNNAHQALRTLNAELEQRITERTAQLLTVNKELEAFSYSVSHDLRAPLRGIDGFSQALLEDYGDKLDKDGKDMLRRIRLASQRMAQLIDDLLNLSRITRHEMRKETVDLSLLARDIANGLQKTYPSQKVAFKITEGLTTSGDPRLLRIVLENLFNNAWKFTSKLDSAQIEFGTDSSKEPIYFVRDNGVGFDMTYIDKLFAPFQRLHAITEFEGTGIGLATVQRIIHRHGGHIWAHAAPGKGATFYFTLTPVVPSLENLELPTAAPVTAAPKEPLPSN